MFHNACQPLSATLASRFFWTLLGCWAVLCAVFATLVAPMLNFATRPIMSIAIMCGYLLIGLFALTLLHRRLLLRPLSELTAHILNDDPAAPADPPWPATPDGHENDEIGRLCQAIVTARTKLLSHMHHTEQAHAHLQTELNERRRIDQQHQEVIQLVELSNRSFESINKRLERQHAETQNLLALAANQIQPELAEIIEATSAMLHAAATAQNDAQKNELQRIHTTSRETINLLTYLAGHNGSRNRVHVAVDLNAVLDEVLADLALRIQRIGAVVTHAPLPTLYGDPAEVTLLVHSLIENALRTYNRSQTPTIHITAERLTRFAMLPPSCDPSLTWHRITFTDNGEGFSPDQRDQLFNMLRTKHATDELGRAAMGLPLCHAVVTQHGGTVVANSIPDQTTTFEVYWPATQQDTGTSHDNANERTHRYALGQ